MLQKNVYIIYPAGYGGNFLNWAINISDAESSKTTVSNPINTTSNSQFGGQGTSHFHARIPTHANIRTVMNFQLRHRIDGKKIYVCNDSWKNIPTLLESDPAAIFVNIHDNDDELQKSFGAIQCCIKWPTYISVYCALNFTNGHKGIHETFNPYDCKDDRLFRNYSVLNKPFRSNGPINYEVIEQEIDAYKRWYNCRNQVNPHEVNEKYYLPKLNYDGRIFEIDLKTLNSESFVEWFEDFMHQSGVSDSYDTTQFKKIAPLYLEHQTNLQWYNSINTWNRTFKIDDYLRSHSIIESELIRHIFIKTGQINFLEFDLSTVQYGYHLVKKNHWPENPPKNIPELFSLDLGIQSDLAKLCRLMNINYHPLPENANVSPKPIDYAACYLMNWENSSIDQINAVFKICQEDVSKAEYRARFP